MDMRGRVCVIIRICVFVFGSYFPPSSTVAAWYRAELAKPIFEGCCSGWGSNPQRSASAAAPNCFDRARPCCIINEMRGDLFVWQCQYVAIKRRNGDVFFSELYIYIYIFHRFMLGEFRMYGVYLLAIYTNLLLIQGSDNEVIKNTEERFSIIKLTIR